MNVEAFLAKLSEDFTGEDSLRVDLDNGQSLAFRIPNDYVAIQCIAKQAPEWAARARNWKALPAWTELLDGVDDDTLNAVYQLATLSVEPKLSENQFLQIARKQGFIFARIWHELNAALNRNILGASKREVEQGNASSPVTQTVAGSSPPPLECMEDTSTPLTPLSLEG